ncbi:GNAT family N-acetyltransferase [Metabacillus malikii]|uniref:RimJ/RimL family protein N-acetyltransferase n=1 Tax=Metabacillus malikii TaxID=1504265 RepID=A0ABT9ZCD3_9BACI|nr:GNAT family N-acetyltransferase [Metabacillus malikii]MDQ0229919.1 RimJ/RimL family protein N-acetyltransferase [Metabacillus malikii]
MNKILQTSNLLLRPFQLSDAERVQQLAGDKDVAKTTLNIPHPYPIEAAVNWINTHPRLREQNNVFPMAVILKETNELIGSMTIRIDKQHRKGELGYWIGKAYWGKGYATEAAEEIVRYGFEEHNVNKICGTAIASNTASCKVMEKLGMKQEGKLEKDLFINGEFVDVAVFGRIKE